MTTPKFVLSVSYQLINDGCTDAEPTVLPTYASIQCPEGYGFMDVDNGDDSKEIAEFIKPLMEDFFAAQYRQVIQEPGLVTYAWNDVDFVAL